MKKLLDHIKKLLPAKHKPVPLDLSVPSEELVLVAARNLIIEKGWGQGKSYETVGKNRKRNFCTVGALAEARMRESLSVMAYWDANKLLVKAIDFPFLVEWNDRKGRKKSEVLDAFDKAIQICRSEREGNPSPPATWAREGS